MQNMKRIILAALTLLVLSAVLPSSGNIISAAYAGEYAKDPIPLKNGKRYDESQDPAFKRCGTNSSGPQHGFFAVPLLILSISGALLYFLKTGGED